MIIDSGQDIMNNGQWKYEGLLKWGGETFSFRTNSKHQYYKLKSGKMANHTFVNGVIRARSVYDEENKQEIKPKEVSQ